MPVLVSLGLDKFPPVKGIHWFNLTVLLFTPLLALYGLCCVPFDVRTATFATIFYFVSTLGVTAGYHRLWSHRSYKASLPLQYFLIFAGASAVQGSCFWWARKHRSHHRHTDTDKDPYNAKRGLLWSHVGWMIFKTDIRAGTADISDLLRDPLVQWQHRWFFPNALILGYFLPTLIAGACWGDWMGGICFAGALRMTICHHSVFCINSLAHHLGEKSYDDKLSPRDHFLSAILTMGEGYHNFHHQFPMDFRNAFRWYQWDPTKWFIYMCSLIRLASQLRTFPSNEIEKGSLTMKLKALKPIQDSLRWPIKPQDLPTVAWGSFREQSKSRTLILVSGFVHDVTLFSDSHPGGADLLTKNSGRDMTASFFGGIYDHSNAAHNLLAMMRVGILAGGVELVEDYSIPPSEMLYIAEARSGGAKRL